MATKTEKGLVGLRAIRPAEFQVRASHQVIAQDIVDLADRGYTRDANAVAKLIAVRGQPMPWSLQGSNRSVATGLGKLQNNALPYECGPVYAAQIRDAYRLQQAPLLTSYVAEQVAAASKEPWQSQDPQDPLEHSLAAVQEKIANFPPPLTPLLQTYDGSVSQQLLTPAHKPMGVSKPLARVRISK